MEAVALATGVSKRTLYKRFPDKAALLLAAVEHLVQQWLPPFDEATAAPPSLEGALLQAARSMLAVTLTPEALALFRLTIAEAARVPELADILNQAGVNLGIARIATLLASKTEHPLWAAEQFQRLVITGPQHRALGLGAPLTEAELEFWARQSVTLFLKGLL